MPKFNPNRLPESSTKTMYISQKSWSNNNLKDTLQKHYDEVESLLQKTDVFGLWRNILEPKHKLVAGELIPEIYLDGYISILFACQGLYKQANVCLRAQLETALRLVYFSTHPIEFKWWQNGDEWRLESGEKDVWGKDYNYFTKLEEFKVFKKLCVIDLFLEINKCYKLLSKYVHSGVSSFQTTPFRLSPKYKIETFKKWRGNFKDIHDYINTIFSLGFANEFKALNSKDQKKVLKVMKSKKLEEGLIKSLGLRFKI